MNQGYAYCMEQAEKAAAEADAATLDNVRERCRRSQRTWLGLADHARAVADQRAKAELERADRREAERLEAEERAAARLAAG